MLTTPDVLVLNPASNSHDEPVSTNISVTFDTDIDPSSVTDDTLALHAMQSGKLLSPPNSVDAFGPTVLWSPGIAISLKPGELVQGTVTSGIKDDAAGDSATPHVWQFRAGVGGGSGFFENDFQSIGSASSTGVALGDMDGDADLDLFVANTGAANRIYRNNDGTFADTGQLIGSSNSQDVALGDLNGDGSLDAFVANGSGQANRVYTNFVQLGVPQMIFSSTGQSLGSSSSTAVALGDIDADGDLDAVVANSGTSGNTVWKNNGSAVFTSVQTLGSSDSTDISLGDLDNDGDLDLFVTNAGTQANRVWINTGSGSFISGDAVGASNSQSVALGDLNDDGHLDAFVGNASPNKVWFNTGNGTFTDSGQSLGDDSTTSVQLGDLNADGSLDAFVTNGSSRAWFNDGNGVFGMSPDSNTGGTSAVLGDIDEDGQLDAVVGRIGANQVLLNLSTAPIFPDGFEANDSQGSAANLDTPDYTDQLLQIYEGLTIHASGNEDWYKWTAPEDGQLTVEILFSDGLGDLDLIVANAAGDVLGQSLSQTDDETVTVPVTGGTTYFFRVFGFSGATHPDYDLVVRGSEHAPDQFEGANNNNVSGRATDLGAGSQSFAGLTIHGESDHDFFKVIGEANEAVSVTIEFSHGDGDLDLVVRNKNGIKVDESESSTDDETVTVFSNDFASLEIFIEVFGFEGASNQDYTLTINSGNNAPTITSIADQTINEDGMTPEIPFTIGDAETNVGDLTVGVLSSSNTALIPTSNVVLGGAGANRTVKVTPLENRHGSSTITLVVADDEGGMKTESFEVNVTAVADIPIVVAEGSTGTVGDPMDFTINVFLTDQDGSESAVARVSNFPANTVLSNGTFNGVDWLLTPADFIGLTLEPPNNVEGEFTVDVTATTTEESNGSTATSAVVQARFFAAPEANLPSLLLQDVVGNEDSPIPLGITANLSDNDGSETLELTIDNVPLNASLSSGTNQGGGFWTLTANQIPGLAYIPGPDDDSDVTLTVTAIATETSTGAKTFNTKLQNVTVNAVADAPNVVASDITANEDTAIPLNVGVSLSDTDGSEIIDKIEISGFPIGANLSTGTNKGGGTYSFTVAELGGLTYTPPQHDDTDLNLTVTAISKEISNDDTATSIQPFDVNINAIADAPTLNVVNAVSGDENTAIPLTINGVDLVDMDGSESLTITISGVPAGATLSAGTDLSGGVFELTKAELPGLTITPPLDDHTDFTLTVAATATETSNGDQATTSDQIDVEVLSTNANPTISEIGDVTIEEDTMTGQIAFSVDDEEGGPNSVTVTGTSSDPTKVTDGNIEVTGTGANRTVKVVPVANASGDVTITLTANDNEDGESTESFTLSITEVNDNPTITGLTNQQIDEDGSSVSLMTVSDPETNPENLIITGTSSDQNLVADEDVVVEMTVNDGGESTFSVTVTPQPNAFGTATITITVEDESQAASSQSFDLVIDPVNDPPSVIAPVDPIVVPEDSDPTTIDLNTVFQDPDGEALFFSVQSNTNPTLVNTGINGASQDMLILDYQEDQVGTADIVVRARDAELNRVEITINVTVEQRNDLPVISSIDDQTTAEDVALAIPLTVSDEETVLTLADVDAFSSNQGVVPDNNIVIEEAVGDDNALSLVATITPLMNVAGSTTITILVDDGENQVTEEFLLTVESANDAPVNMLPAAQATDENVPLVLSAGNFNSVTVSDADHDGGELAVSLTIDDGTLTLGTTNNLTSVAGNGTSGVTLTGTLASINTALDGLTYSPSPSFSGVATLTIESNDQGNTGSDGPKSDLDTLAITVNEVNEAPVITSSDMVEVQSGQTNVVTVTATDDENDVVGFSIVGGADLDKFAINSVSGGLLFLTPPDVNNPTDANGDNVYEVRVQASDGSLNSQQLVRATVVTPSDSIPPTVEIEGVASAGSRAASVPQLTITFSEAVAGFDLSDLTLARTTGETVSLLPGSATLTTTDNITYTLGNLTDLTRPAGNYELTLDANGSGIQDAAGNGLANSATRNWLNGAGDANEDGEFNQGDIIDLLQGGKYRTQTLATWGEGDFTGDGFFDQVDIIAAIQPGHYRGGPLAATSGGDASATDSSGDDVPLANDVSNEGNAAEVDSSPDTSSVDSESDATSSDATDSVYAELAGVDVDDSGRVGTCPSGHVDSAAVDNLLADDEV